MSWCTPARALVVGCARLLSIQTFPASSEYARLSKSNGHRGKLRGKRNEEEELPLVTPSSFTLSPEVLAVNSSA